MKKNVILVLLILGVVFSSLPAWAGEIEVKVNEVEDQDAHEFQTKLNDLKEKSANIIFKCNGGPTLGVAQLQVEPLNAELITAGFKGLNEVMVFKGGGGIIGSGRGSRIGGYGYSGKTTSINGDKTATLLLNYGGFLYEKGLVATKQTDLALGLLMGGGNAELDLFYGGSTEFAELLQQGHMNQFKKDFILLEPKLTLHQNLSPVMGLELSLGYLITYDFGKVWTIYGEHIDGPLENLAAPTLHAKVSFGF